MKKLIIIIALIGGMNLYAQQDRHFSMFFANPVQLNPGAAGNGLGDISLFTNFRSQWFTVSGNPFRSFSASVDGKLFDGAMSNGFIGAGMNFYSDLSGDSKYKVNIVSFPVNYTIQLDRSNYLAVGLQPAYYAQSIDDGALYFDSQWTGSGFNTDYSSGEALGSFNASKFDISAGIYAVLSPSKNQKYRFGVSGYHLSKQKISFYGFTEKLYRNMTLFGQADLGRESSNLSFHPAVFAFFQGPNREFTIGNNFEYLLKPSSIHTGYFDGMSIGWGLYYRTSDALIANVVYRAGGLTFGASYDLNHSKLRVASNGVGAFELFLAFNPSLGIGSAGAPRIR